jgi:hypothetical protein
VLLPPLLPMTLKVVVAAATALGGCTLSAIAVLGWAAAAADLGMSKRSNRRLSGGKAALALPSV